MTQTAIVANSALASCEQQVAAYMIPCTCTYVNHIDSEMFTHFLKNVTAVKGWALNIHTGSWEIYASIIFFCL